MFLERKYPMLPFDYTKALYRKNNNGKPTVWFARPNDGMSVVVYHGIIGNTISVDYFKTMRLPEEDVRSRFDAKRKAGYKYLSEIRDSHSLPVEEELIQFLTTYLPNIRTNAEGKTLAMLAKTFDNENNKYWAYLLKGKVLEEQKEYSKAIEAYKEAMKRTENKMSLQYKIKSLEAKVNKK